MSSQNTNPAQGPSGELAPEVIAFLEKIGRFAETLEPTEANALRRIVEAGMVAADTPSSESGDTQGFYFNYNYVGFYQQYYGHFAAPNIQKHVPTPIPVGAPQLYHPNWWLA
jgi:hypothetical protein